MTYGEFIQIQPIAQKAINILLGKPDTHHKWAQRFNVEWEVAEAIKKEPAFKQVEDLSKHGSSMLKIATEETNKLRKEIGRLKVDLSRAEDLIAKNDEVHAGQLKKLLTRVHEDSITINKLRDNLWDVSHPAF